MPVVKTDYYSFDGLNSNSNRRLYIGLTVGVEVIDSFIAQYPDAYKFTMHAKKMFHCDLISNTDLYRISEKYYDLIKTVTDADLIKYDSWSIFKNGELYAEYRYEG